MCVCVCVYVCVCDTGPITLRPPQLPPTPAEVLVNGVCFPHTDLTTTADVTYVLNQQPGKLRIKDVKVRICVCAGAAHAVQVYVRGVSALLLWRGYRQQSTVSVCVCMCHLQDAIRSKQREQDAHRAELDAIMAQGMNGGVHPLERPEVPAHIKVRPG